MTHHTLPSATRRALLQRLGALGLGGPALGGLGLNLMAMGQAAAAEGGDYRALVCLFLQGGNDAANTVLATDADSWAAYTAARSETSNDIRLPAPGVAPQPGAANLHTRLGGVLPITPATPQTGRSFALHPCLGQVARLFGQGRLAIVPNIGAVVGPTTKAAWLSGTAPKPPKLFSHNDQQAFWQTLAPEGTAPGWGGRLADLALAGQSNTLFASVAVGGLSGAWLNGLTVRGYQMAGNQPTRIGTGNQLFGSPVARQTLLELMRQPRSPHLIEREHAAVVERSIQAEAALRAALPASNAGPWGSAGLASGKTDPLLRLTDPVSGQNVLNPVALQLQSVARVIAARQSLGTTRQVFFINIRGFDTHGNQCPQHAVLLAQLSHALGYFDEVLTRMGLADQVTTFTASDFGRTFASNGNGTDHGWGGHSFVMGGQVRGGDLLGRFPTYAAPDAQGEFNSDDMWRGGAFIPSLGIEPFAASLGRWFGVSPGNLMDCLPGLSRWPSSQQLLPLMA